MGWSWVQLTVFWTHGRTGHRGSQGRYVLSTPIHGFVHSVPCHCTHLAPLLQVVHAGAGKEGDTGGCVGLILFEVEVQAQPDDANKLEEVDVQVVRLWTIGLPEE